MTAQQILEQAINGVLQEKALSKEAINAVQAILTENENLKVNNESLNRNSNDLATKLEAAETKNREFVTREANLVEREKTVTERERKQDLLNLTITYEQTRVSDIKSFIETVFRNTVVRRNVSASVPIVNNGYQQGSSSSIETHETREE